MSVCSGRKASAFVGVNGVSFVPEPKAGISPQSIQWENDDSDKSHHLISPYYVRTSLNYHYHSYSLKIQSILLFI